jgi:bacteriorhodopsin
MGLEYKWMKSSSTLGRPDNKKSRVFQSILTNTTTAKMHQALCILVLQGAVLVSATNNALDVNNNEQNGKFAYEAITTMGSDWYYAICSVMGLTAICIIGTSYMKPRSDRIFFYMCAAICTTASIAYFTMGSNLGWTPIDVEFHRNIDGVNGRNREIFYVRYVDWYVAFHITIRCICVNHQTDNS